MKMEITFSGWNAMEERRPLRAGEEPRTGRVYTMFHGTLLSHARAIISNGFQCSRNGLLGPGVYVSRNIDKAKCYPPNTDKKDSVVFKLKVWVGKVKKIDCDNHPHQKTWHQNGYDSAWVPPNCGITTIKSGREEDCVWDPSRVVVVDVACCMDAKTRKELRRLIRSNGGCSHCHQDTISEPHPLQSCWTCNEQICPFQKKHVCKAE